MKQEFTPPSTQVVFYQIKASCLNIASPGSEGAAGSPIEVEDGYELD